MSIDTNNNQLVLTSDSDNTIRWKPGDRFHHIFQRQCDLNPSKLAVDGDEQYTYLQLEERANQLAWYLKNKGVKPGDCVALLLDKSINSYVGMLAVLKLGAVYVPLDAGFPIDRLAYIIEDANVETVVTLERYRPLLPNANAVCIDTEREQISSQSKERMEFIDLNSPDELCYIIYTSGSTGKPKGVAVNHSSIYNFVQVAAELYGVKSHHRMYQGMTIAFDFSVEEIWVSLAVGATLVPNTTGANLLGEDLHSFLTNNNVTAMCCVPTLLATLDQDLPNLNFLLVSGEACPQDLVRRWYKKDRIFLNVYGPTEAAVTSTWTHLHPDLPVTIGVPLPTYSALILDENEPVALERGVQGELAIAGVCLARGYVNRDDLTERAFIVDFLELANNPSGRIYRTGDLARINEAGEIEYLGRIDTQVKIRGYRIELTEIESVVMQFPGIAQAVVTTHTSTNDEAELAVFYTAALGASSIDVGELMNHLRAHLPNYMVPTYLEQLDFLPMLPSDKVDRRNLPKPTKRLQLASSGGIAPSTATEKGIAAALCNFLNVGFIAVDDNFFEDLGANSLLMARFSAVLKKQFDRADISMRDIYLNPTVEKLAAHLDNTQPVVAIAADVLARKQKRNSSRNLAYFGTGVGQVGCYLAYMFLIAQLLVWGHESISASDGMLHAYLRSIEFAAFTFISLTLLPVAAKWILIGRWKPDMVIEIWGLHYLRFWIVQRLVKMSPMLAFAGSPLYNVYLRMLGAKIGRNAVILSRSLPLCTDLVTVGDGAVICKGAQYRGFKAEAGFIHTGTVTIGNGAYVSENSHLDINTAMGENSQLGHTSMLARGQSVAPNKQMHGSPAIETDIEFARLPVLHSLSAKRKVIYSCIQLANVLCLAIPFGVAMAAIVIYIESKGFLAALALYLGSIVFGLSVNLTVPRLLNLFVEVERARPLYGLHYAAHRALGVSSNSKFLNVLFGDSSYVLHYLRTLGLKVSLKEQTGSNFGLMQKWDSPFVSKVGEGTMVSDDLTINNASYSSSSFTISPNAIGARNFLGNKINYPVDGRTGDNCLLGTKVMIPIDGPIKENIGLLGSPAFEIPRNVRQSQISDEEQELLRQSRLPRKNASNLLTMGLFLLTRFIYLYLLLVLVAFAIRVHPAFDAEFLTISGLVILCMGVIYHTFVERACLGFKPLVPRNCSIYDPYYWKHERYWKLNSGLMVAPFYGTPFMRVILRLLGVKVGKRLYDGGSLITEKTLVQIGDDCTLNDACVIQGHSLEDGIFKSDHIVISDRCTIGAGAFVHYGVIIGNDSIVDSDSFLMKGESVPCGSRWQGNPAQVLDSLVR